jgi:hypothetical protein
MKTYAPPTTSLVTGGAKQKRETTLHTQNSTSDAQGDSSKAHSIRRANGFGQDHSERDGGRDSIRAKRRVLSDLHWRMLNEESGILPDVIFERAYETIDSERQRALGFPIIPEQAGTESLLIRLHGVSEEVAAQYQVRPNVPRTLKDSNGKPRVLSMKASRGGLPSWTYIRVRATYSRTSKTRCGSEKACVKAIRAFHVACA